MGNKDAFLNFCPKCGSNQIGSLASSRSKSVERHKKELGGSIGTKQIGVNARHSNTKELLRENVIPSRYGCRECGYQFDNGQFVLILNRMFFPTDLFIQEYRIITGLNGLSELMSGLQRWKGIFARKLFSSEPDVLTKIKIKVGRIKMQIQVRKQFDMSDGMVKFILEKAEAIL